MTHEISLQMVSKKDQTRANFIEIKPSFLKACKISQLQRQSMRTASDPAAKNLRLQI